VQAVDLSRPNEQNFQDMFTQAQEKYKSLTEETGGYHGENLAQTGHYNADPITQAELFYTETADAFSNLVMAATSDKDLLSTITSTYASLTEQLTTKDRLISNLQAHIRNATTTTNTDRPNTQKNY
jgi:hypothetical protein